MDVYPFTREGQKKKTKKQVPSSVLPDHIQGTCAFIEFKRWDSTDLWPFRPSRTVISTLI